MSNYGKNSKLAEFIYSESESYNRIADAVKYYAISNRKDLQFLYDNPTAFIEFDDFDIKYVLNVTITGDNVEFDAVVEGTFSYKEKKSRYDDFNDNLGTEWFSLHCTMEITDRLKSFKVTRTEIYTSEKRKKLQSAATGDFVPVITRDEYDSEAEAFLQVYCPEAIAKVMPVPMSEIVEQRMGLSVIDDIQLTKDLAIFGQICFNDTIIKTYDSVQEAYIDTEVKRGTIFIDPNTVFLRCIGCAYNTLAHEAFHWWRHRIYATVNGILKKEKQVYYRCPTAPSRNTSTLKRVSTDEDWMERQANAIAPKILMPKVQTEKKIKQLIEKYEWDESASDCLDIIKNIIDELASFYAVSKQAAKIRMIELGYHQAAEVYNYDSECFYSSHEISVADAFDEIRTNDEFRTLIDMELFRFANGYFVINTDKYAVKDEDNNYVLTDYAKENLSECALNFRYNALDFILNFNRENGVMYKQSRAARAVKIYAPEYNEALVTKALEEVPAAQKAYEDTLALGDETVAQTLKRYMDQKHWNSAIFQVKTGLNTNHYSRIKTKLNRVFELPVLVSICVGLDLPLAKSLEILEKAGFKLNPQNLDQCLYYHILSTAGMRNIYACNEFLKAFAEKYKVKIHLLGSEDYKVEQQ